MDTEDHNENSRLQAMEDAMVLIQKSLNTIKTSASKFVEMEGSNREVLGVMTQLTNKVTSLEAKIEASGFQGNRPRNAKVEVPLYVKVSLSSLCVCVCVCVRACVRVYKLYICIPIHTQVCRLAMCIISSNVDKTFHIAS